MGCPGENTLLELVEDRLAKEAQPAVAMHLAGCAECQELLSELDRPVLGSGLRLGRYLARHAIGSGGMGVVYEAFDPLLSRRVALKLLRADFETDVGAERGELKARLLREAKALARLAHPNVVAVHDVGYADDRLFLAMDFVDGTTLAQWLEERRRTWSEILDVYLQAGRGLAAAHEAGVTHRDFKPANVLVGADGRVVVTDFGLARVAGVEREGGWAAGEKLRDVAIDETVTRTGALLGSPAFMSPEQLAGRHADARSDVFSFCVSLWAGLYGTRPFRGTTIGELHDAIVAQALTPTPGGPDVPPRIRDAVANGLRVAPDERPQDMRALVDELERQRAYEGLSRAERILREAQELFRPPDATRAMSELAVSLLEGAALGERRAPKARKDRPDLPNFDAVEVTGRRLRRFMELMGPFESIMSHFFVRSGLAADADGIVRFDPEGWYPYALAIEFSHSAAFGPDVAQRIGYAYARAVLETEGVPRDRPVTVELLHEADVALNRGLRLDGTTLDRFAGSAGGRRDYVVHGGGRFDLTTSSPSRCAVTRGYLAGMASHFGCDILVEHCEGPCRDQGDVSCRYLLQWIS